YLCHVPRPTLVWVLGECPDTNPSWDTTAVGTPLSHPHRTRTPQGTRPPSTPPWPLPSFFAAHPSAVTATPQCHAEHSAPPPATRVRKCGKKQVEVVHGLKCCQSTTTSQLGSPTHANGHDTILKLAGCSCAPRHVRSQSTNLSTTTSIAPRVRRLALPNPLGNLSKMDQVPGCNSTATFPARPLALGCFYPALPDEAPARHNLISRRATFAGPLKKGHRSETAVLRVSFAQSLKPSASHRWEHDLQVTIRNGNNTGHRQTHLHATSVAHCPASHRDFATALQTGNSCRRLDIQAIQTRQSSEFLAMRPMLDITSRRHPVQSAPSPASTWMVVQATTDHSPQLCPSST
ncbi:hypothetical protein CMEL01_02953, partial [Colletotrichum melonis]